MKVIHINILLDKLRIFVMLRKLLEFSRQPNMTLERSVKAAMTWVFEDDITS
ncbi:hypothetical protein ACFQDF_31195 [Ectobacillus funiculus]|uniref:Uncharacterized protein n=1 Tax=Ectobacillus funiculus TaxID=137993 RepID=A0ABV5WCX3_9BACI